MDKILLKILKIIGALVIVYLTYLIFPSVKNIFSWLIKILTPFILGFVGAYLLKPIVDWLVKRKIKYKTSVFIVVVGLIFVCSIFGFLVIPRIITQTTTLITQLPNYIDELSSILNDLSEKLYYLPESFKPTPSNIYQKALNIISNLSNSVSTITSNFGFYFMLMFLTPILIVYFLLDFNKISDYLKYYLIKKEKEKIYDFFSEVNKTMRAYFNGVLIVMLIMIAISSVIFKLIGLDLSLLWGLIIGITNIIPYIGPYIGGAVVVVFALTYSFEKALIVLIVIIVLQLVESNLISPNIHSKTINSNPILVLLFVSIFGEIFGIFGMILAVPMLSIFQILFDKIKILKK